MKTLLTSIVVLALMTACDTLPFVSSDANQAAFTGVESGINGEVWMGPMVPVISIDNADRAFVPVAWDLEVFTLANGATREIASEEDGTFSLPLPAGVYRISAKRQEIDTVDGPILSPWPRAAPVNVVVPDGEWVSVKVDLDTGIR